MDLLLWSCSQWKPHGSLHMKSVRQSSRWPSRTWQQDFCWWHHTLESWTWRNEACADLASSSSHCLASLMLEDAMHNTGEGIASHGASCEPSGLHPRLIFFFYLGFSFSLPPPSILCIGLLEISLTELRSRQGVCSPVCCNLCSFIFSSRALWNIHPLHSQKQSLSSSHLA